MTDNDQPTGAAPPPRATKSAPDSMSLSEFAKTEQAAQNAASWERVAHGSAEVQKLLRECEDARRLLDLRKLELDKREAEIEKREATVPVTEGLEGRVRGVLQRLRDENIRLHKRLDHTRALAIGDAADLLEADLLTPPAVEPPAGGGDGERGGDGLLTAEQMIDVWRELLAGGNECGIVYQFQDGEWWLECWLHITGVDRTQSYMGRDPDPERAFWRAVEQWRAATGEKEQE